MPPMKSSPAVDAQLSTQARAYVSDHGAVIVHPRQAVSWNLTPQELDRLAEVWQEFRNGREAKPSRS